MAKITLNEEEKLELLKSVNDGVEPSPDLLIKLFPGTAEKFDIKALDRAKIPTLEYAGKRSKAAILAEAGAGIGAAPLQVVRSFGDVKEGEWQNLIVQGDNLQFLKTCYRNEDPVIKDKIKEKVKLVYIDPPFATKSDFGGKNGEYSYSDKIDRATFLETLRERLICLREILAEDGSIYIHLDQKMSHYVKIIMDEVFGKDNFRNEVVWSYRSGGASKKESLPKKHDNILFYSKTSTFEITAQYERQYLEKPFMGSLVDENGKYYVDTLLRDVLEGLINVRNKAGKVIQYNTRPVLNLSVERIDYPTQKPEGLLSLLIEVATKEGDLVMDCFAGSGTTIAVAEKLGRKWIGCDFGKHSIYTIQKRILRIAESKKLGANIEDLNPETSKKSKKDDLYNKNPMPFSVISAGAYDYTRVMALGRPEHKDTYIAFVLALFQLCRDEEQSRKLKIANIYTEKDGAPVEVYPVWDEHYLKDVRIDEEYLKGIIIQTGGRLRGEYYIITPEHCTNIGETTLKNSEGKNVTFKFLTFPYKVLEDAARHLELHDQPSSQESVNELITSTAFYFNEDVEIEVKRNGDDFILNRFDTKILDKGGNRFSGLSGLAMVLVDVNYEDGKPFDMDKTIFAKDIGEDGVFSIGDTEGKKVAIIAIDKHGNESKPFIVK